MSSWPLFSIIHPSARPHVWRTAYEKWIGRAARPSDVEYVLGADARWGFEIGISVVGAVPRAVAGLDKVTWNEGRKCIVDNANMAAAVSTGQILVVIADDIEPPEDWDRKIRRELEFSGKWTCDDVVIEPGVTPAGQRDLMLLPFFTRARYERVGYAMYPDYESMFADNDFGEHARADQGRGQTTIVNAKHVVFQHNHPAFDPSVDVDPVYRHQNRQESYALGARILERRRVAQFVEVYPYQPKASTVQIADERSAISETGGGLTIACCLPGENFSDTWVTYWDTLLLHMVQTRKMNVQRIPVAGNLNHYQTRIQLADAVLNVDPKPDLVLWLDDDNVITPAQFDMLLADLEANPSADGVTAWTWIKWGNLWRVSCGDLNPGQAAGASISGEELLKLQGLRRIFWTGFPCFLMWTRALEMAGGARAFRPYIADLANYESGDTAGTGFSGEDYSWCRRAADRGVVLLMDARVYVPHLKRRPEEPTWGAMEPKPQEGTWKAPNGRRFERTGEVREVLADEWHWCGATIEPMTPDRKAHVCEIWREVSADRNNQATIATVDQKPALPDGPIPESGARAPVSCDDAAGRVESRHVSPAPVLDQEFVDAACGASMAGAD